VESKSTSDQILDIAQSLIQAGGYEGFSYASIATELGIRKASIHHHFPTKGDLALRLIQRYQQAFQRELAAIDAKGKRPKQKLEAYAELYVGVLRNEHRLCLCGMYAAELPSLPADAQEQVRSFFRENERWLAGVLSEGATDGSLVFGGKPDETARLVLSSLEGGMLVARAQGDVDYLRAVARRLIEGLGKPRERSTSKKVVAKRPVKAHAAR
jgi:TetR/AcrR family transcriptional repressor of nem operon